MLRTVAVLVVGRLSRSAYGQDSPDPYNKDMNTAATAALAASANHIKVTVGSDDIKTAFFAADDTDSAFAAAAERSLNGLSVKAIEVFPGGSTVSTFQNETCVSVECF